MNKDDKIWTTVTMAHRALGVLWYVMLNWPMQLIIIINKIPCSLVRKDYFSRRYQRKIIHIYALHNPAVFFSCIWRQLSHSMIWNDLLMLSFSFKCSCQVKHLPFSHFYLRFLLFCCHGGPVIFVGPFLWANKIITLYLVLNVLLWSLAGHSVSYYRSLE